MPQPFLSTLLRSAIPPVLLLLSGAVFTLSLYTKSQGVRSTLFLLILYLSFMSIQSARADFGLFTSFTGHWTQVITNQVLHAFSLLFIEEQCLEHRDIKTDAITWRGRTLTGYKLWNNVRRLPARDALQSKVSTEAVGTASRYVLFYTSGIAKLMLILFVHFKVLPLFFSEAIGELESQDLSPTKQILIRRYYEVSSREVVVRTYIGVYWAWKSFISFDCLHTLVSWCFVTTGYDDPEEWPPLFGSVFEATGLRRFWANFWHQLIVPTYRSISEGITALLGLKPESTASRTIVAALVFGMSGLLHGITGYIHGSEAWDWNIWWFVLNFVACSFETAFIAATRAVAKRLGLGKELRMIAGGWLGSFLGYAYVAAFLFWSVPKWQFPDMHTAAVRTENFRTVLLDMLDL